MSKPLEPAPKRRVRRFVKDKQTQTTIIVQGYFVSIDKFNRAKLMFLDDYEPEDTPKETFAKKYIMHKTQTAAGYSPISPDNKYFVIKCPKSAGGIVDTSKNGERPRLIPISELIQHKVECTLAVKEFKFRAPPKAQNDGPKTTQGWNLNLLKIRMVEY